MSDKMEAERAAFEAWYLKETGESRAFCLGRNSSGEYAYAETEGMWMAWEERSRRAPAIEVPEINQAAASIMHSIGPTIGDVLASKDAEIADLRAQLARQSAPEGAPDTWQEAWIWMMSKANDRLAKAEKELRSARAFRDKVKALKEPTNSNTQE